MREDRGTDIELPAGYEGYLWTTRGWENDPNVAVTRILRIRDGKVETQTEFTHAANAAVEVSLEFNEVIRKIAA